MKNQIEQKLSELNLLSLVRVFERDMNLFQVKEYCFSEASCLKACRECSNYGRLWTCPPFEDTGLNDYERLRLIVCRISAEKELFKLYQQVKSVVHKVLLEYERNVSGQALSFAGSCDFCSNEKCSRLISKPCRHPGLARASLEGVGFDVGKIVQYFFDLKLEWYDGQKKPSELTFVGGVLYNP